MQHPFKQFELVQKVIVSIFTGAKINVFDIVATRAQKISDLRVRSKFL